jgi:hypothetical protein
MLRLRLVVDLALSLCCQIGASVTVLYTCLGWGLSHPYQQQCIQLI